MSNLPRELPALTPLRGIAAVAVLLGHANLTAAGHAGASLSWAQYHGYLAVDLFFFLSGFVLTHVYGSRFAKDRSWPVIRAFLWARFCRIYPTVFFTTMIFVMVFMLPGRASLQSGSSLEGQLFANFTLMQVPWLNTVVLNFPSWSVSAELYSYICFPFLIPLLNRSGHRSAVAIGIVLLVSIAVFHTVLGSPTSGWGALSRGLMEFTAGILAYRLYKCARYQNILGKDVTFVTVFIVIAVLWRFRQVDGMIVLLLLALLLAAVSNAGITRLIINVAPFRWLGDISYSVYIFQAIPLWCFEGVSRPLVAFGLGGGRFELLVVLIAIGSGHLIHRCIDLPTRRTLRGLPSRIAVARAQSPGLEKTVSSKSGYGGRFSNRLQDPGTTIRGG